MTALVVPNTAAAPHVDFISSLRPAASGDAAGVEGRTLPISANGGVFAAAPRYSTMISFPGVALPA
jgi:hypothetical protein